MKASLLITLKENLFQENNETQICHTWQTRNDERQDAESWQSLHTIQAPQD